MRGFELLEPRSLAEAGSALGADMDVRAIAGGTALLTIIKQRRLLPKSLVKLKKISNGVGDQLPSGQAGAKILEAQRDSECA